MNINTVKPELLSVLVNLPAATSGNHPQGSNRSDSDDAPESGQDISAASNGGYPPNRRYGNHQLGECPRKQPTGAKLDSIVGGTKFCPD